MNEVWFLMSLFPGTSVSLPWQPTVPLFLRQNLDDFWLDDFWIVLLDCEVTLENASHSYSPASDTPTDGAQSTSDRSLLTTVDLRDVLLVKAAHYIALKASVNSPRLSKVIGCRPSKRRDVYSFSILSISISFSILKFLSQSLHCFGFAHRLSCYHLSTNPDLSFSPRLCARVNWCFRFR